MSNWGVVTWVGVLLLMLLLVIYYKGASALGKSAASSFGTTARALTGQTSYGTPVGYA